MIKPLIRRTVRSMAVRIMARPALAVSIKKLISLAPALDQRLRRIVDGPHPDASPAQRRIAGPVPPEVARVLVDLRHALAEHESERAAS